MKPKAGFAHNNEGTYGKLSAAVTDKTFPLCIFISYSYLYVCIIPLVYVCCLLFKCLHFVRICLFSGKLDLKIPTVWNANRGQVGPVQICKISISNHQWCIRLFRLCLVLFLSCLVLPPNLQYYGQDCESLAVAVNISSLSSFLRWRNKQWTLYRKWDDCFYMTDIETFACFKTPKGTFFFNTKKLTSRYWIKIK